MGIGVNIPQGLWTKLLEIKIASDDKKCIVPYDGSFTQEFLREVETQVEELETFIRTECIINGNYILNPNTESPTSLRYSGQIIRMLVRNMTILAFASTPGNRYWQERTMIFLADIENFLKSEAAVDGNALENLFHNAKKYCGNKQSQIGVVKYKEAYDISLTIALEQLGWVHGNWKTVINGQDTTLTPEMVSTASLHYFKAIREFWYLIFDESSLPENFPLMYNGFKAWVQMGLDDIANPSIALAYCPFIHDIIPEDIIFFKKPLASLRMNENISAIEKFDIFYKFLAVKRHYYKDIQSEEIDKYRPWLAELFIFELAKEENLETLNTIIENMKQWGVYEEFREDLTFLMEKIPHLPSIMGEHFEKAYKTVLQLPNDEISKIFINSLKKCWLNGPANKLTETLADQTTAEYVEEQEMPGMEGIAYLLTKTVPMGIETNLKFVHNAKEGSAIVEIDYGSHTEQHSVEIINFFSQLPVTLLMPVVVKISHDIAFVVVE